LGGAGCNEIEKELQLDLAIGLEKRACAMLKLD
jgi:hypothetical protein